MKTKLLRGFLALLVLGVVLFGIVVHLLTHRAPGAFFDSNGVHIFYSEEGKGEPVILIHGMKVNGDLNWRRTGVVNKLAKEYRVITFDLRGHGLSDSPEDASKYGTELVEDVVRLMDHLHIPKAHMVGYSLGGFITLKLLELHPERITDMVICAAGWRDPSDHSPIPSPYSKPSKTISSPPVANAATSNAASLAVDSTANTPSLAVRAESKGTGKVVMSKSNRKGPLREIRRWFADQYVKRPGMTYLQKTFATLGVPENVLRSNTKPALCLIGTNDGLLSMAEQLHDRMAQLGFQLFKNADHLSLLFYPSFKDSIYYFIKQHPMDQVAMP